MNASLTVRPPRRRASAPFFAASLLWLMGGFAQQPAQAADPAPAAPLAQRIPKDVTVHGDRRIDDYFWLRERDNPAVLQHLKAEQAYTDAWFAPLSNLSQQLFKEAMGRIQQADEAVPVRQGAWYYSSKTLEGQQYPLMVRRAAQGPERRFDASVKEEVMLDLNLLAQGQKFLALRGMQVSRDGRWLAYLLDFDGSRDNVLRIRDLSTGQDQGWTLKGVSDLQWSADSRTLYYITHNASKRADKLWAHTLGSTAPSAQLFEEKDELFNLGLGATLDGRFLQLVSSAKDMREVRLLDTQATAAGWQLVMPRRRGLEYSLEHREGQLYLTINDRGPNYRLVRLPAAGFPLKPAQLARAQTLIAHRADASIDNVLPFKTAIAVAVREGGNVTQRLCQPQPWQCRTVDFPEPAYTTFATTDQNPEADADALRVGYGSMVTPSSVYDIDLKTGALTLKKRQPVLGGFDPSNYESRRVFARAKDGTQIPVSLVYAKAKRAQGPQPLLLRGYGSYGIPSDPRFSSMDLNLLDRGVVVAIAHIRGGGDLGRIWYQQGKLAKKMNTFTDFIAVAETLIHDGWTRPEQLVITGGSAGGLLMGAVTNLRPELFKAVVAEVPFVDVINTMLDETLPLTTEEFIEWGNPKKKVEYQWMRAYSPYDNLKRGAYPAMLARAGLNDTQVPYWEAAKYIAKLRTLKTNATPTLYDINMDVGHGGASGRFDALKERAKVQAFMLQQWGLAN